MIAFPKPLAAEVIGDYEVVPRGSIVAVLAWDSDREVLIVTPDGELVTTWAASVRIRDDSTVFVGPAS